MPSLTSVSFDNIMKYIDMARVSSECQIIHGGYGDKKGYFIEPTIILTTNPKFVTMQEEIFGPVVTLMCMMMISIKKLFI